MIPTISDSVCHSFFKKTWQWLRELSLRLKWERRGASLVHDIPSFWYITMHNTLGIDNLTLFITVMLIKHKYLSKGQRKREFGLASSLREHLNYNKYMVLYFWSCSCVLIYVYGEVCDVSFEKNEMQKIFLSIYIRTCMETSWLLQDSFDIYFFQALEKIIQTSS